MTQSVDSPMGRRRGVLGAFPVLWSHAIIWQERKQHIVDLEKDGYRILDPA
jgi:hypothetical protein